MTLAFLWLLIKYSYNFIPFAKPKESILSIKYISPSIEIFFKKEISDKIIFILNTVSEFHKNLKTAFEFLAL